MRSKFVFFVLGVCWFFLLFHRETRRHGGRKGREREESLSLSFSFSSPSPALFLLREPPHFFCMFLFYRSRMTDRQKVSFFFETWMSDRRVAGSTLPKWFGFCVRRCGAKRIQKRRGCFVRHKASFFLFAGPRRRENFFFPAGEEKPLSFFLWCTHTHTQRWLGECACTTRGEKARSKRDVCFFSGHCNAIFGWCSLFVCLCGCVGGYLVVVCQQHHAQHAASGYRMLLTDRHEEQGSPPWWFRDFAFFFFRRNHTRGTPDTHTHINREEKNFFSLKGGGVVTETPHPP